MASLPSISDVPNVRPALLAILELERTWEGCAIGLALTTAYFEQRGVTADSLAAKMVGMSSDTARRRLSRLADLGRAERFTVGRRHLYRATPAAAMATVYLLNKLC